MYKILTLLTSIFICFTFTDKAKSSNQYFTQLSDSSKISILTSAPWAEEPYAVFGHSAMRIQDPSNGIDYVFNYGIFDFQSSNFIYRFAAGETDYIVAVVDYQPYITEYQLRGVDVYEQVINLDLSEKQNIWNYLLNNIQPENRVYRYNIFYNNCTTKLVDILENNTNGKIIYNFNNEPKTFRNLVHECVYKQLWLKFGIDLAIGSGADKIITSKEKMFLPIYQKNALDGAFIQKNDGSKIPLVNQENLLAISSNTNENQSNSLFQDPLIVGILVLIVTIAISVYGGFKKKVICTIYDTILFLIAGIGGCIIFFLMGFSVHPCTAYNWNIVWLNPFELIFACIFFVKPLQKYVYYYHFINFAILVVFLLAWNLIPQQLEIAFIPFISSIAIRSGMNVLQYKKNNHLK